MNGNRVQKRETTLGQWAPALLYGANWALWAVTAVAAGRHDLLWLALFPAPAWVAYLMRSRRTTR